MIPEDGSAFDISLFAATLKVALNEPWEDVKKRLIERKVDPFEDREQLRFELVKSLVYWLIRAWPAKDARSVRLNDGEIYIRAENEGDSEEDLVVGFDDDWAEFIEEWYPVSLPSLLPTPSTLDRLRELLSAAASSHEVQSEHPQEWIFIYSLVLGGQNIRFGDRESHADLYEEGISPNLIGPREGDGSTLSSFVDDQSAGKDDDGRIVLERQWFIEDFMPFYSAYQSIKSFHNHDRVSGLKLLYPPLLVKMPWAKAFVDYQVSCSAHLRSDLEFEEWLTLIGLVSFCVDTGGTDCGYNTLNSDSGKRINAPLNSRTYWAWRFGFVSAMGSHLLDRCLQEFGDFDIHPGEESNVLTGVPSLPLAIDLMMSMGTLREWEQLRTQFADIFNKYDTWCEDEGTETKLNESLGDPLSAPILPKLGMDWPSYWATRMGYADGMLLRTNGVVLVPESIFQSDGQNNSGVSTEVGELLEKLAQMIPPPERVRDQPPAALDTIWEKLPYDAKVEFRKAERHFQEEIDEDSPETATLAYSNAAEILLRTLLSPKIRAHPSFFIPPRDKEPYVLGEFERVLENMSKMLPVKWKDETSRKILSALIDRIHKLRLNRPQHGERKSVAPEANRHLVLGGLAGANEPGIFELINDLPKIGNDLPSP